MSDLISRKVLYQEIARLEELARGRVLDTPTSSPFYDRYSAQLNERTNLKYLVADAPTAYDVDKVVENLMNGLTNIAISALEKQIPKKIKVQEGTNYTDGEPYNILTCTECDCEISDAFEWEDIDDDGKIKKFAEGIEIEYFQFCIKCGQRLDWSIEE